ncbi:MAG: hypothetical protein CME36_09500 [unclassified Hahellaceae]|nr:hypothetical protein [Hahellaceae bacterium]|tara:strand:- start:10944 stop:11177 length:234 start_codon:yes stop_codon:yes gene_type:complete
MSSLDDTTNFCHLCETYSREAIAAKAEVRALKLKVLEYRKQALDSDNYSPWADIAAQKQEAEEIQKLAYELGVDLDD